MRKRHMRKLLRKRKLSKQDKDGMLLAWSVVAVAAAGAILDFRPAMYAAAAAMWLYTVTGSLIMLVMLVMGPAEGIAVLEKASGHPAEARLGAVDAVILALAVACGFYVTASAYFIAMVTFNTMVYRYTRGRQ